MEERRNARGGEHNQQLGIKTEARRSTPIIVISTMTYSALNLSSSNLWANSPHESYGDFIREGDVYGVGPLPNFEIWNTSYQLCDILGIIWRRENELKDIASRSVESDAGM